MTPELTTETNEVLPSIDELNAQLASLNNFDLPTEDVSLEMDTDSLLNSLKNTTLQFKSEFDDDDDIF